MLLSLDKDLMYRVRKQFQKDSRIENNIITPGRRYISDWSECDPTYSQ